MNLAKFLRTPVLKNICERLPLAQVFFIFYLKFFYTYLFWFCRNYAYKRKTIWRTSVGCKIYIKERDWILRLHQQIRLCGIWRLKFCTNWVILTIKKTSYNIRNSKSDLRLHNFREFWLGNKQLSSRNKVTKYWKKYQKWVVFCEITVVKLIVIFPKKHLWMGLPRRILYQKRCFFGTSAAMSYK